MFSELNFFSPDETLLKHAAARIITLEPGDVLFLPQRWWHYAECLSTSISVNTWIPINNDHMNRLGESIVQYFVRNLVCDSVLPTVNFQKVANSVVDECWSLTRENCFKQIVESINVCSNIEDFGNFGPRANIVESYKNTKQYFLVFCRPMAFNRLKMNIF